MKKTKIIILIITMILGVLVLTGCTTTSNADDSRFIRLSDEGLFRLYYDKYTKVMYAMSASSYNYGTVTLLVDAEGKPLLYN